MDELVDVQQNFVNDLMDHMKLDQDYLKFKKWIEDLAAVFSEYALDNIVTFF